MSLAVRAALFRGWAIWYAWLVVVTTSTELKPLLASPVMLVGCTKKTYLRWRFLLMGEAPKSKATGVLGPLAAWCAASPSSTRPPLKPTPKGWRTALAVLRIPGSEAHGSRAKSSFPPPET